MLTIKSAFTGFSVKDIGSSLQFYSEVLGLPCKEEDDMGLLLELPEKVSVFLYPKPDHTPATFTVLNFIVPDIEKAVAELSAAGVKLLKYGPPIETDEKGIYRTPPSDPGPYALAWFKDPSGNILSVLQES